MNQRIPYFWGQYDHFDKQFLTADFSPRKYFRWQAGNTSLVLMDCPDLSSLKAFIEIGQHLTSNGLSAPEIIEADTEVSTLRDDRFPALPETMSFFQFGILKSLYRG